MINHQTHTVIDTRELDQVMAAFFQAVSFEPGQSPSYNSISAIFIQQGLLINNNTTTPEIWSADQFIQLRQAAFIRGDAAHTNVRRLSPSRRHWS